MTSTRSPGDPPEDPWESARLAARADVAEVFSARQRTCPACGHLETGPGRTCSACGAELVSRRPRRRWRRRTVAAVLLGLLALVAAVAVLTAPNRRHAQAEARRDAARQAALEAAERRRLRAEGLPMREAAPARAPGEPALAHRRELVGTAERLITRDALGRVRAGELRGPVAGTECVPYPPLTDRLRAEADPAARVGRYECVAYRRRFALPELEGRQRQGISGSPFWAVIDYRRATIVWCKVTPRAGEGGRSLASVPVPPPCRDPLRRSG